MESSKTAVFSGKMKRFLMSKAMIITYGIFFLLVIPGVALFAKGATINMENLDRLGSYLSGIGTVVAAVAAVYGVNGWVKQLKKGKYLDIIWEAKVNLRKVYLAEKDWYIYASRAARNQRERTRMVAENYWGRLEIANQNLSTSFNSIDQIIERDGFAWQNHASELNLIISNIHTRVTNANKVGENLERHINEEKITFQKDYDYLLEQLDFLEEKHSK